MQDLHFKFSTSKISACNAIKYAFEGGKTLNFVNFKSKSAVKFTGSFSRIR